MPVVSVTRARIRRWWYAPGFAFYATRAFAQAQRAGGFRGGAVLRDRSLALWTMTAWDDLAALRAYVGSGAHRAAMPHFGQWCDEASVVHWEQPDNKLPDWLEADRRMRAEGRPSRLRYPAASHADLSFAPPCPRRSAPIEPA